MWGSSRRMRAALPLLIVGALIAASALAQAAFRIDVPAQSLADALRTVAQQTSTNVLFEPSVVNGLKVGPLRAELSSDEAIAVLLRGTGLTAERTSSDTIVVKRRDTSVPETPTSIQDRDETIEQNDTTNRTSADLRLAQAPTEPEQGSASVVHTRNEPAHQSKAVHLEEVVVTGSRLRRSQMYGPQEVKIYSRESIDQSGQSNVADFLSTLPDFSVSINETNGGYITSPGATTVKLHGLPLGTTLVLLDGRRLETSGVGQSQGFFDLNNIPLSFVDRVEVLSEGSSAVYGSDAIGGVVNIILRKNVPGFEANVKYGGASGIDESASNVGWGHQWERGGIEILGSYMTRGELVGSERALTSTSDYRAFGGQDARSSSCNPGNVFSLDGSNLPGVGAPEAAVPAGFRGRPSQAEFAATAGMQNLCSLNAFGTVIPSEHRAGLFAAGTFEPNGQAEFYAELAASQARESFFGNPPALSAFAGYTVSAANPFNPFGEAVGISNLLSTAGRFGLIFDTTFVRSLIGARGKLFNTWEWDVAAWDSRDRTRTTEENIADPAAVQSALNSSDPAAALNPFIDGAAGSPQLINSLLTRDYVHASGQTQSINGFLRGEVARLPAGAVQAVMGSEYDRDEVDESTTETGIAPTDFHRMRYAIFGEAHVPVLARREPTHASDILAFSLAARYDHYEDFGGKATPQFGAEWRPISSVLIRGTYSRAFKAPNLSDLFGAGFSEQVSEPDPLRANQVETFNVTFGSNPHLQPETGVSKTLGVVYASQAVPDLQASATYWSVDENNSIQSLIFQSIIENESLFPGSVIRASSCAGGPPCPIVQVNDLKTNFGRLDLAGFDFRANYAMNTSFGRWSPAVSVTNTYRYTSVLTPNTPPTDRTSKANNDGNWSPRWKGTASLGWQRGPVSAQMNGRYTGHYQDYDSTKQIGGFWLLDLNLRVEVGAIAGQSGWLKEAFVSAGAVNLLNTLPQFSNFGFGGVGFDPLESDIRGRFVYVQLGVKL